MEARAPERKEKGGKGEDIAQTKGKKRGVQYCFKEGGMDISSAGRGVLHQARRERDGATKKKKGKAIPCRQRGRKKKKKKKKKKGVQTIHYLALSQGVRQGKGGLAAGEKKKEDGTWRQRKESPR